MTGWRGKASTSLAICCLLAALVPNVAESDAVRPSVPHHVQLPTSGETSAQSAVRMLTGEADAKLHTSALHQTSELGEFNNVSLGSKSYKYGMHGIKKGAPATCYGLPCNASACYPAASVSVKTYVNYVNVTALVEFSRRYNVSCLVPG